MKIYLIRHAEAIEYETETVTNDEYRYITGIGRKITRKTAKHLRSELNELDKIFTSPLIRAVQTAEIFAAELKFKYEVALARELKNESSIVSLQELLDRNADLNSVALVGHEPKMSLIVKCFSNKKNLPEFGKSSVCLIEKNVHTDEGTFRWYFDSDKMEFEK